MYVSAFIYRRPSAHPRTPPRRTGRRGPPPARPCCRSRGPYRYIISIYIERERELYRRIDMDR